ncbi:MAG: NAD(P)/FAD-dependent oxidoreductase [Neomegalonema sp.]|nr:NAD(P)/FAD-dependent oxidoreductase [Neomegalonema sp.]
MRKCSDKADKTDKARREAYLTSATRRSASRMILAAGASVFAPAIAQARPRLVVVGGGAAGATVAKYVAKDSPKIQVTLVEDSKAYTSCFFSNLYLAGLRTLASLTHRYDALAERYGVTLVTSRASAIDRDRKLVRLADGSAVAYDRLALSPGVSFDYDAVRGYTPSAAEQMPHAYQAGFQTFLLRRQIAAMRPGGVFVLAPPTSPYRCPPGPYERASMIAKYFKRRNPTAKIIILDAKDSFAKQPLFEEGWAASYPGMIEWRPASFSGGGLKEVDVKEMLLIDGEGERIRADAASVIPPQRAGDIALSADLTDSDGWAVVDGSQMRSRLDPNIFIVGDAARAGAMPKSGFAANSQARVAALAIRADLDGATLFPARFRNTCWSFIDNQNVVKVGANYAFRDGDIRVVDRFVSKVGEPPSVRFDNTLEANAWYGAIASDMLG